MDRSHARRSFFLAAFFLVGVATVRAQAGPAISLSVDATEAPLKILRVQLEMPVSPGPLTLYYPKWIPGTHEPVGPIANVTGLKFMANGTTVPWRRDLLDIFTFHVDVPQGSRRLDVSFDFVESSGPGTASAAGGTATAKLLDLNWYQVVLYPAGTPAAQLMVQARLRLPRGWKFGTALPVASQSGDEVSFPPVALDRLADSPLIAGEYYRVVDLTPPGEPIHHEIDLVADSDAAVAMSPEVQRGLTNLVLESGKLFGARHYRAYRFLLTLSEHTAHFGLEHHESSDNRLPERQLLSPDAAREVGGLLAHEFAHSWSGKFRRPKDLTTPDFQTPMQTDLLWVYEGNTSYLGDVLAARSGLWTLEVYHQCLSGYAANLGPGRPGRTWRPLLDTAVAVPGMFGRGGWGNWRRGGDYYEEAELVWLEVANIIHTESHGQKTFEDFFHSFYGGTNNGPEVKPYTFDELVASLHQVVSYDWARFLNERLMSTSAVAPTGGLEAGGWKVAFTAEPPLPSRGVRGVTAATYSIGLDVGPDGSVADSFYGGAAFRAGVTAGMKVVGVNGHVYTPEILSDAIKASKNTTKPIELLVLDSDYYKICAVDYHDGEKYPHLVRDETKPNYLDEILRPLAQRE